MIFTADVLLDRYFETAFSAPDGIKRLRELILTLAMQGKLVPQDPSDQPARELLKEIEAEKQKLIKAGKIKKQKLLPKITADEIPYDLPENWEWVKIRNICHDWGQKKPDRNFTYIDVGIIDNKNGLISDSIQILEAKDAPSRARKIVKKGTVIYSTVRPYLLNIAIVEQDYKDEPIASTAFAILHPYSKIYNRFIYYILKSPYFIEFVEDQMKGVAYPAINDGNFFEGLFPLPPLAEQKRIVEKCDRLMAQCDKLEQLQREREQKRILIHTAAREKLLKASDQETFSQAWDFIKENFGDLYAVKENVTSLRQAILQLAVMGKLVPQDPGDQPANELLKEIEAEKQRLIKEGKIKKQKPLPDITADEIPYDLPNSWSWSRLEDIVDIITGISKGKKYQDQVMKEFPYLRVANVQRGYLDLKIMKYLPIPINDFSRYEVLPNDLLITEGGDWDKVGRTAIWNGEVSSCIHQNHVFKARRFLQKQNIFWLQLYLNSLPARTYFASASKQTTNLASINKTQLRSCPIPLPPFPEQNRIVAKVDALTALCDRLENQIDQKTSKQTQLLESVMAGV
ncbi:restriction endonuclease subunit S [Synechocystis sp. LEGE 06083]|uniref:restriction endonuclease subunit S n=1 Tax=Synechocystis sp. LEGE 06083 TaxID=915336 RepID=UPI00187EDB06|nr:restriction endonuclease subunit S [Synechocystis sp. LEGE 06083]MBE9194004.1 restriction endonuclease subunit S [Synechocystis sp. LEGE 06083]